MKKITLLFSLFFILPTFFLQAQNDEECATEFSEDPNFDQQIFDAFYNEFLIQQMSETDEFECEKNIVVKFHILRNDAGQLGLDPAEVQPAFEYVEQYFSELHINFILADISFIDDSDYYNMSGGNIAQELSEIYNVDYAINVYCAQNLGNTCGFATLPWGTANKYVFMKNSCMDNTSTLTHEIGHYFGLYHTHQSYNSSTLSELVDGSNCIYTGDRLCDTPADPRLSYNNVNSNCDYTGTSTDANGDLYVPDPSNIMSYSRKECRTDFSLGQLARMSWYLYERYPEQYFPNPVGYEYLGEWQGQQYYLSEEKLSPADAMAEAASLGGHLAVINSLAENNFLAINIEELTFIGLNDADVEGTLAWQNGDPVDYTNFSICGSCKDNDDQHDYVWLHPWDWSWSFADATEQRKFIVEIPCEENTGFPDLDLTQIVPDANPITIGQTVDVTFDLMNIGNKEVNQEVSIQLILSPDNYLDHINASPENDVFLADYTLPSIGIETIEDIMISASLPSNLMEGNYFIFAVVDFENEISELQEFNNTSNFTLTILPSTTGNCFQNISGFNYLGEYNNHGYWRSELPEFPEKANLMAESLGGYLAVINDQAENDFLQQHISNFTYIGLSDTQTEGVLEWANGDPLDFTNFDICSFCNANGGTYDQVVMHHWNGAWSFSNSNRIFIVEIPCSTTSGTPDLTLSNPTGLPSNVQSGDQVTVTFDLNNIGTAAVAGDYVTAAYLSTDELFNTGDIYLEQLSQSNTSIGTVEDLQLSFSIPNVADGNYYVLLITDANDEVVELEELNNGLEIPIEIFSMTNPPNSLGCNYETMNIGSGEVLCSEYQNDGSFTLILDTPNGLLENQYTSGGTLQSSVPTVLEYEDYEIDNNTITKINQDGVVSLNVPLAAEITNQFSIMHTGYVGVVPTDNNSFIVLAYERTFTDSIFLPLGPVGYDEVFALKVDENGNLVNQVFADTLFFGIEENEYYKLIPAADGGGSLVFKQRIFQSGYIKELSIAHDLSNLGIKEIAKSTREQLSPVSFGPTATVQQSPCSPYSYMYSIDASADGSTGSDYTAIHYEILKEFATPVSTDIYWREDLDALLTGLYRDVNIGKYHFPNNSGYVEIRKSSEYYLSPPATESSKIKRYSNTDNLLWEADFDFDILPIRVFENTNGDLSFIFEENGNLTIATPDCSSGSNCPEEIIGFTMLGEFNGSKYFISNDNAQPAAAQLVAQQNGGYLAVINDQAENDFLQQHISEMSYIGLNDAQTEGSLVWGNGEAVSFTNFDICSFCNDNSELDDYVIMHNWNGGWSWSKYYNERKYIVEVPCQSTPGGTPDLTLSNPTGLPATVQPNDQVTVTFDLNNIGTAAVVGDYVTAAYLSTDELFNAGDIYLEQLSQSNTPIGTVENLQLSFSIPNVSDGNYYVLIIADVNGDVTELEVLNNGLEIPIAVQSLSTSGCPNEIQGFTTLGEFNGNKYYISNNNVQPAAAQLVAQQNGGYLAVINDQAENDFLQQHISEMAYIGLNDAQMEGTLVWENGDAVSFTNFDICSFCNDNSELDDYVVMHNWNGGWSWSKAYNERKYIVEIPCGVDCNCVAIFNPVCGSDGVTYSNSCEAECAGEFSYTFGSCYSPTDCPDGKGWSWITPQPTGENILNVDFVDTQNGWLLLRDGMTLRTADGGTTWEEQAIDEELTFTGMDFVTPQIGYAVAWKNVGFQIPDEGYIYKTTNGGEYWTKIFVGNRQTEAVFFINENIGWVSTNGQQIFKTIDGGNTWTPYSAHGNMESLHFVDEQLGWAANLSGRIIHTTDGGLTWNTQLNTSGHNFQSIHFSDAQNGWAVGTSNNGSILKTTNGGQSWETVFLPFISTSNTYARDVFFKNPSTGWVIGNDDEGAQIFYTEDGGLTWQKWTSPMEMEAVVLPRDIAFANDETWVVGSQGFIGHSSNGEDWEFLSENNSLMGLGARGIFFLDEQRGWAATWNGIKNTVDGGKTWTHQDDISFRGFGTYFSDSQNGWVVGTDGGIAHTTDGGATWTEQISGVNSDLEEVFFIDAQNGWAGGILGKILHTSDGGQTWEIQKDQGFQINGIHFIDLENGWAVSNDLFFSTTDGGATWVEQILPVPSYIILRDVSFIDNELGWVVGTRGRILHTKDGGTTWGNQDVLPTDYLSDVHFFDANIGWAGGDDAVYFTENGGKVWSKQNINIGDLNFIEGYGFLNPDKAFAFTLNGGIKQFGAIISQYKNLEYIGTFNEHDYYLSNSEKEWGEAKNHADENGGYLLSINDQAENDFIQQYISELTHIGLSDEVTEGSLNWQSDESFGFSNIEPCSSCNSNTDEFDFGVIQPNGKWSFGLATDIRKYIVEIPCGAMMDNPNANALISKPSPVLESENIALEKIHPNPSMDFIYTTIQSPMEQNVGLQIFDARGELVKTVVTNLEIGRNVTRISIADFPSGFYSVFIPQVKGGQRSLRFVKVRD